MAAEVRRFSVTVPAGTAKAAGWSQDVSFPSRIVQELEVVVPPGPRGELGFALGAAGVPVLPIERGAWIVTDDEVIRWPLDGFWDSGSWALFAYNTGQYPHTLEVRFLVAVVGSAGATPRQLIDAAALLPVVSGGPLGLGGGPGLTFTPPPLLGGPGGTVTPPPAITPPPPIDLPPAITPPPPPSVDVTPPALTPPPLIAPPSFTPPPSVGGSGGTTTTPPPPLRVATDYTREHNVQVQDVAAVVKLGYEVLALRKAAQGGGLDLSLFRYDAVDPTDFTNQVNAVLNKVADLHGVVNGITEAGI